MKQPVSDCMEIAYDLPLLPNNNASETFILKLVTVRTVDWMFIGWGGGLR